MTRSVRGACVTNPSSQAQRALELRTLEPEMPGSNPASATSQLDDLKQLNLTLSHSCPICKMETFNSFYLTGFYGS